MSVVDNRVENKGGHCQGQQHEAPPVFDQPFIGIEIIPCEASFVLGHSGEGEEEAEEEGVGDDVLGSLDAGVALEEVVGLGGEDDDGGGDDPEEAEDELLLDVGVDEGQGEEVHAHGPGGQSIFNRHLNIISIRNSIGTI